MRTLAFLMVLGFCFPLPARANDMFQIVGENKDRVSEGKYNRVISIYVREMNKDAMQGFARERPWDGEGTRTTVCFFDDRVGTPDVTFSGMNFSDHYKDHWIAVYYHESNGDEVWIPRPAERREVQYS